MTTQPEALRLADALEAHTNEVEQSNGRLAFVLLTPQETIRAAAELRRLHGLDFALRNCELALKKMATKYMDAVDQRDALLEALKLMLEQFTKTPSTLKDSEARVKAHAAISKATGRH